MLRKLLKTILGSRSKQANDFSIIDTMTGYQFEKFVADLLKQYGFTDVRLTEHYDLGVDIIAEKDGVRWGIQTKRYNGLVKAIAVRQVVTALRYYKCERGMVITNNYFSRVAIRLAVCNECVLVDRTKLKDRLP